jgi:Enoyl-CoA hydratase/carnithine racemase
MAGEDRVLAGGAKYIDFKPIRRVTGIGSSMSTGEVATLTMDVDENAGLFEGYQLKLNSYDLGVDIELADAVQRLRFEHPAVKVVCALGQEPGVLRRRQHPHAGGRDPRPQSQFLQIHQRDPQRAGRFIGKFRQRFITVVNGTAAGGGYELALATDHIMLADDGSAAVSLPEVPLLRCCRAPAG